MYQSVNELINSYDDDDDLPMQLRLLASRMYLVLQTAHSARLLVVLHVQPLLQFAHTGIQQKHKTSQHVFKQESSAIADKPARRESLPKIAPIRRAYNVVADNTGLSSFV